MRNSRHDVCRSEPWSRLSTGACLLAALSIALWGATGQFSPAASASWQEGENPAPTGEEPPASTDESQAFPAENSASAPAELESEATLVEAIVEPAENAGETTSNGAENEAGEAMAAKIKEKFVEVEAARADLLAKLKGLPDDSRERKELKAILLDLEAKRDALARELKSRAAKMQSPRGDARAQLKAELAELQKQIAGQAEELARKKGVLEDKLSNRGEAETQALRAKLEAQNAELQRLRQALQAAEERLAGQGRIAAREHAEREHPDRERAERERQERERAEREHAEREHAGRERPDRERAERERQEREHPDRERAERERQEREHPDRERAERERQERERAEREHAEREHAGREHPDRERAERERQERERAEREHAEREHAGRERPDRERAERERQAHEHAQREHAERQRQEREHPEGRSHGAAVVVTPSELGSASLSGDLDALALANSYIDAGAAVRVAKLRLERLTASAREKPDAVPPQELAELEVTIVAAARKREIFGLILEIAQEDAQSDVAAAEQALGVLRELFERNIVPPTEPIAKDRALARARSRLRVLQTIREQGKEF